MDRSSLTCDLASEVRPTVPLFLLLTGLFLRTSGGLEAGQAAAHPFIEPKKLTSQICFTCHPAKAEGKFVHPAVDLGCENCHQPTTENEKTIIKPVATGPKLCATCHEVRKESVRHGPYNDGRCLVCHEPHSSNFPYELRAQTNILCMTCHGVGQPDVKVNASGKTVSLPGSQTLPLEAYEKAPKLVFVHSAADEYPTRGHPITGKDPRNSNATLDCLSCHHPHSSQAEHLLRQATDSRNPAENLCLGCHADLKVQIQKPTKHAAGDMGCGTCHRIH